MVSIIFMVGSSKPELDVADSTGVTIPAQNCGTKVYLPSLIALKIVACKFLIRHAIVVP